MFTAFTVSHAIDIMQTRSILTDDTKYERNPVMKHMSPNEATVAMTAYWAAIYLAATKFPKYRTWIIGVPLTVSLMCVTNNFILGVQF